MKRLISFILFAAILLIVVVAQKARVQDAPPVESKSVAVVGNGNSF